MTTSLHKYLFNGQIDKLKNLEKKRHLQKLKILKYLYLNGSTTNAELCNRFNMSLPTSMSLLNQLTKENIIIKKGRGKSDGGRKPDLFGLRENSFFVMCIQIENFKIKLALVDNNHSIVAEKIIPSEISPESNIINILYDSASHLIESSGIDIEVLMGIGISMPGLVSSEEGKNFTYFLTDQQSDSLQIVLKRRFNKPVFILNDAKSACLAELNFGQAKNKTDVQVISWDWGIGLGIIMGGKMHTGSSGFAGEFGHIPMIENGLLCHCGKRGCLETVASGLAMVQKAKEGIQAGQTSILSTLSDEEIERLEPKQIINAANKGDQFAINIISEIGINLGKGIAILIQIFNPELIILEGKIADAKQFITTPIQQSINTYCMMQLNELTEVKLSTLGPESTLLGSTVAVMDNIFKERFSRAEAVINKNNTKKKPSNYK